jgi:hypothetical protein
MMLGGSLVRRVTGLACGCLAVLLLSGAGLRGKIDPASVVPLEQIPATHRDQVAEIIREATLHQRGKSDSFPCNKYIYLCLLNEPTLTLALWQDLAQSPARLEQVGQNSYQGSDGAGTIARWDFLLRTPQLHVLLADIEYTSPRSGAKLKGRVILLVRAHYYRQNGGESWVQHDIEAFVKIDSLGWKAVAATVRPVIEKVLEEQLLEAGWFVSLMGRLVESYPNWAVQIAHQEPNVRQDLKANFRTLIAQTRKPGASTGRPMIAMSDAMTAPNSSRSR